MGRRPTYRLVVLGLALALIVVGGALFAVRMIWPPSCAAEKVDAAVSPLQSAEVMQQRPDADRDRTVAAVNAMGAPFGPVVAGRDYYYDQFLRLYGVPGGVLAWTKNSAPVTLLDDETLDPRWSLKPTAKRTAWDVSEDKFLLLDLEEKGPVTIGQFGLRDAARDWCVEADLTHREGDPVSTAFLDDGDVVLALPDGGGIALLRLDGDDGDEQWARKLATADRADYVGSPSGSLLVVGGSEESRLTDPAVGTSTSSAITGIDPADGSTTWTWDDGPGSTLHVVGDVAGRLVVMVRNKAGIDLVGISGQGKELWRTLLPAGGRQTTLRGQVVLTRSDAGLTAYDALTGTKRWSRAIPADKPSIPLGFTLGQMPSVDAEHLLLPTVSSLELLDLTDGTSTSFAMPTEGLSSDYFAYQLLASDRHLGVVTNTGAVVAARE